MTEPQRHYSDRQVVGIARRVTWVGFAVNAALTGLKIAAGIIGRSSAMVADGVHSLSDFVTDVIVIVMIGVSRRKANTVYQYGYGKYETLATVIIGAALGIVALGLFAGGLHAVVEVIRGNLPEQPGMIALWMALISILAKEILFHYTRRWGQRIGSAAVIANAWHHRSDAFSSLATLTGISGAIFLGPSWRIFDPIAAMLVSLFILRAAINIARPAVMELLDASLPPEIAGKLKNIIKDTPGIITYHHFRSRRNGAMIILDVHIKVNPNITVEQGHSIATDMERRLKGDFGRSMIVNVHVEPYRGQKINPDGSCKD